MKTMHRSYVYRDEVVAKWIQRYCVNPDNGGPAVLTPDEHTIVRRIYSGLQAPLPVQVNGKLACYLVLAHLCGCQASFGRQVPKTILLAPT
jgi:hypothetical protein